MRWGKKKKKFAEECIARVNDWEHCKWMVEMQRESVVFFLWVITAAPLHLLDNDRTVSLLLSLWSWYDFDDVV